MEQVTFKNNKQTLYLVATPIGNLSDMTYRAVETLKNVSMIFAEDTRNTKILLNHYNIQTPMKSLHMHNEKERIEDVMRALSVADVALVSDAGMPLISDPGYLLVQEVQEVYNVSVIPGPNAALTALVASGIQTQPFTFIGFLPKKKTEQMHVLKMYEKRAETLIIYESPFRIKETIKHAYEAYGNRKVCVARELTKIYETFTRLTLEEASNIEYNAKGEYVIVIEGAAVQKQEETIEMTFANYIKQGEDEKEAMKKTAQLHQISKRDVYAKIKVNKS